MSISFMKQPIQQTFYIATTSLNAASVVKVLGIYIQQNLKWDTQVKEMFKKCNERLFMLRTLKRFNLPLCDLITIHIQDMLDLSFFTQISLRSKLMILKEYKNEHVKSFSVLITVLMKML